MKLIGTIPYNDTAFVWVNSHYDIHLEGLCTYSGMLCRFVAHDNTDYQRMAAACPYCSSDDDENWDACTCDSYVDVVCDIYQLTPIEKLKWIYRKTLFELCVGRHWSYPDHEPFTKPHPWLFKLYYWIKRI